MGKGQGWPSLESRCCPPFGRLWNMPWGGVLGSPAGPSWRGGWPLCPPVGGSVDIPQGGACADSTQGLSAKTWKGRCSPSARAAGRVPGLVAAAPTWWSEACSDLGLEAGRAGSEQESGDSLPWARWAGRWWRGLGIYTRPGGWQGGIQCHQPGGSVLISVPLLARLRLSALPVFVICLCVSPRASGLLSL